jgi:hypothetical protein
MFVIILTCGLGLVTLWPAVDEYFVLVDECAQLELSLVEAQQEIEASAELRRLAGEQAQELAELRKRMLSVADVHGFSSRLVDLTRSAGCQLRRVDLGEGQSRKWHKDDHCLRPTPAKAGAPESPYELRTQRVALSITGPLDRVHALLGELHALERFVHTQHMQIKPATDERDEVHLDLELLFFDLQRVKKTDVKG